VCALKLRWCGSVPAKLQCDGENGPLSVIPGNMGEENGGGGISRNLGVVFVVCC
jgi:hypothetical protein